MASTDFYKSTVDHFFAMRAELARQCKERKVKLSPEEGNDIAATLALAQIINIASINSRISK